jgi:death-on-curing protein
MTRPPIFLTVDHIVAIHRRVVEEFGGDAGVRDHRLLESTVAMPAARKDGQYVHPGLAAKAAAYLFHLCRNHPFADGNKRTALAAAETFLAVNGAVLAATDNVVESLTAAVADNRLTKPETITCFRRHARRRRPKPGEAPKA